MCFRWVFDHLNLEGPKISEKIEHSKFERSRTHLNNNFCIWILQIWALDHFSYTYVQFHRDLWLKKMSHGRLESISHQSSFWQFLIGFWRFLSLEATYYQFNKFFPVTRILGAVFYSDEGKLLFPRKREKLYFSSWDLLNLSKPFLNLKN